MNFILSFRYVTKAILMIIGAFQDFSDIGRAFALRAASRDAGFSGYCYKRAAAAWPSRADYY